MSGVRRIKPIFLLVLLLSIAAAAGAQTRRARKAAPPAAPAASENTRWPLESIRVEGNHAYSPEQILAVAGLHVGQKADKPEFEAARERLMASGVFDMVGYRFAPAKSGKGYDATIEVSEFSQLYPLRFEDLPVSDAQMRAWLKQKDPLFADKIPATEAKIGRYTEWIAEFLGQHGYREPLAGKVASPAGSPGLEVVFRPAKARPSVARVKFTNSGDLPAGMLQTAMHGVAIGASYTEAAFRQLLDTTVRPLYEARGRIRVSFPKIETEPAKDVDGVDVSVQVEQGPVYKLGRL